MVAYATKEDLQPLIGNLANQRSDLAYDNAIAGASGEVNVILGRASNDNVDSTHPQYELIRNIVRKFAAAELIGNVTGQLEVRQSFLAEAKTLIDILQKFDLGAVGNDFVSSSQYVTWPANPAGVIYSTNYKNLRKSPKNDLAMTEFNLTTPDTFNLA